MARINIEDSIWSDSRFMKLLLKLQDERTAIGAVVMAWKIAQKYWCPDKKPIPHIEWLRSNIGREFIDVGLADEKEDGVYVRGSEKHFAWWFEKQDAGRRSAESRKKKYGSSQPQKPDNFVEQTSNTTDFCSKIPEQVFENPRTSFSSSFSFSNSKKNIRLKAPTDCVSVAPQSNLVGLKVPQKKNQSEFIKAYVDAYQERYKTRPSCIDDSKTWGRVGHFVKNRPMQACVHLIQVYLQLDDPWFIKKFHDLETFFQNVNKVAVSLNHGRDPLTPKTTAEIMAEMGDT